MFMYCFSTPKSSDIRNKEYRRIQKYSSVKNTEKYYKSLNGLPVPKGLKIYKDAEEHLQTTIRRVHGHHQSSGWCMPSTRLERSTANWWPLHICVRLLQPNARQACSALVWRCRRVIRQRRVTRVCQTFPVHHPSPVSHLEQTTPSTPP